MTVIQTLSADQAATIAAMTVELAADLAGREATGFSDAYDTTDAELSGVEQARERGSKAARSDKAREIRPVLDACRARPSRIARRESIALAAKSILAAQQVADAEQTRRILADREADKAAYEAEAAAQLDG